LSHRMMKFPAILRRACPMRPRERIKCLTTLIALQFWVIPGRCDPPAGAEPRPINYETQIRPIFASHCIRCHGEAVQQGGLRLDHPKPALRGGDSGKVIIPDHSDVSELIRRVASEDEF